MALKPSKKPRKPGSPQEATGPHAPVSNEPEEATEAVARRASQAPSEGREPRTQPARDDGTEAVKGFKRTRLAEAAEAAAAADLFVAPDMELRDIGEASFGPPPPLAETVHGPDDRIQITNTTIYPWRAIASLQITANDNSQWIGTAWFIGPHTLMTAGHVVYIKNSGVPGRDGWVKSIKVMPGRNGANIPWLVTSNTFRTVSGWANNGDQNYDYGAIIIPTELGNTLGWFGFGVYSDADLVASIGNIAGYPGDKPAGTLWYDARKIDSVNSRKVFYDIDTAGGQSGSAVYRIISGQRFGIAVHAYGGATTNSGTRIVSAVYNNMVAWKA